MLVEICIYVYIVYSIVVSIPACHAGDRGSIPRRGAMKLKPNNQTLKEINDSKIIAIDYYYLEKLFKWFTEY